ncbi:hypothetical protein scyTo_0011179 [Scyliorhinus torazame]|uniref:Uncharacterized protein n=1 Tax=Scyliorhinus torazame TaxID=75743 RepID=A0A401NIK2_SCYTO|nr:hypothetical protein [Scyliorhinus torazame]
MSGGDRLSGIKYNFLIAGKPERSHPAGFTEHCGSPLRAQNHKPILWQHQRGRRRPALSSEQAPRIISDDMQLEVAPVQSVCIQNNIQK